MPHFGLGARGALITPLRVRFKLPLATFKNTPSSTLHDPGFDPFDLALENEVRKFQRENGHDETGLVDDKLYKELTAKEWPTLFQRCLMVIGRIENHGYGRNFRANGDRAGLTAGIIGFTAKYGYLNVVLSEIDQTVIKAAFTAHKITEKQQKGYQEFLALGNADGNTTKRVKKAVTEFEGGHGQSVVRQWRQFFSDVLLSESGRTVQEDVARRHYFKLGEIGAAANELTSEFGTLLMFSINVQSNLTSRLVNSGTDRERRIAIVLKHTGGRRGNKENFETRHVQLARGLGFPNEFFIDLTKWGFDDPDTAPPSRSRILSLGMSSKPAMAALAGFERHAIAQSLVEERVWDLPHVTTRLAKVKLPFANPTLPNDKTPNLSKAWRDEFATKHEADRAAYVDLLIALDELPLDCLVLGSHALGTGKKNEWMWSAEGPLKLQASLTFASWKGAALSMPLTLKMPHGLVILYAPNAITHTILRPFARRLSDAITTVTGITPLCLGWHGKVTLPGVKGPTPAERFFTAIKKLLPPMGPPQTLRELIASMPEAVIQEWGRACHETFAADKTFSPLWRKARTNKKTKKETVDSACAAMGPDSKIWLAKATPENGIYMERVKP